MATWTAGQIGKSGGAYSGSKVSFSLGGETIEGTLTRSDHTTDGSDHAYLTVDGVWRSVPAAVPVEVS
jgi:hypothetical protein